jgi:pimeloyl-ACP methyl ester carboxylesterase
VVSPSKARAPFDGAADVTQPEEDAMAAQATYPIIYVRGFAGGTSGIDSAVDDPFYGFNSGATHVRINGDGQPQFYQFEGPLVRLIEDEDYRVVVHGGQQAYLASTKDDSQPPKSIWIYRFYDAAADTFGTAAVPYDLPAAAKGLLSFVDLVRRKTGAAKVWLVAHSMGGLICRSMIQKVCPENNRRAGDIVDKFFTYATPHNGIAFAFAGLNITVPEIAPFGAEIFNHEVMYRYLCPESQQVDPRPAGWDAHDLAGSFDPARVFCLIGTDAGDYGIVSKAVGPKSDGLVQIDNAYVRQAGRSFVHRAHSGSYGEVNSEEGYQNLRRFLFGARKATVDLVGARLPGATDPDVIDVWQAEIRVSVRGLPVLLTEQTAGHHCPIELGSVAGPNADAGRAPRPDDDAVAADPARAGTPGQAGQTGIPLTSVFLLDPQRAASMQRENLEPQAVPSTRCRYTMQLSVLHLQQKHGLFSWHNHLESLPEWADALIVDIGPDDDGAGEYVWAQWQSANPAVTSAIDPITSQPLTPGSDRDEQGGLQFTVALPAAGLSLLGAAAAIRLGVQNLA